MIRTKSLPNGGRVEIHINYRAVEFDSYNASYHETEKIKRMVHKVVSWIGDELIHETEDLLNEVDVISRSKKLEENLLSTIELRSRNVQTFSDQLKNLGYE